MFRKKDFVIVASVGYFVLIMLFVKYQHSPTFSNVCTGISGCIRFCCREQETCNDTFIRSNFNVSSHYSLSKDYKIMMGEPKCSNHLVESHETWTFRSHGDLIVDDSLYSSDEYCFQDVKFNREVVFNLTVCKLNEHLLPILNFVFMSISALLMIAAVFVYAYFKDLRVTASGKSEFHLLISLMLMCLALPFFQTYSLLRLQFISTILLVFGFVLSFLWMSVLSFDIWWTIRSIQQTSDGAKRFKFYCYYVYGLLICIAILTFAPRAIGLLGLVIVAYTVAFLFVAISISDVLLLILSAINLFILSRKTNLSDHKRFWIYIQLFVILFITSAVQLHSWLLYDEHNAVIVADALACFSVILIFIGILSRKETREFFSERYNTLTNI